MTGTTQSPQEEPYSSGLTTERLERDIGNWLKSWTVLLTTGIDEGLYSPYMAFSNLMLSFSS